MTKSPGQLAYEQDVAERPNYFNGRARLPWENLPLVLKKAWEARSTNLSGDAA